MHPTIPRNPVLDAHAAIRQALAGLSPADRAKVLLMLVPAVMDVLGEPGIASVVAPGNGSPACATQPDLVTCGTHKSKAHDAGELDLTADTISAGDHAPMATADCTAPTESGEWADAMAEPDARELALAPKPPRTDKQQAYLDRRRKGAMTHRKRAAAESPVAGSFAVTAHGHTVQVVRKPNGTYHRRHYVHERDPATGTLRKVARQRTLGTTDPAVARRRAEAFLEAVHREERGLLASARPMEPPATSPMPSPGGCITVADAVTRYVHSKDFAKLGAKTRSSYRSALAALAASLGHDTVLESISTTDLERHAVARMAPGFRYRSIDAHGHWARTDAVKEEPVKTGTVNADFTTFAILWNWCARTPDGAGQMLVRFTPGPAAPRQVADTNARRPAASEGRLVALVQRARTELDAIRGSVIAAETSGLEVAKGQRQALRRSLFLETALLLAGLCGQRVGDIARLEWSDIDLTGATSDEGPSITFRIKNTRGGAPRPHKIHLPDNVLPAIKSALGNIGSQGMSRWVFPAYLDRERHVNPDELGKWLDSLTERAGLSKLHGGIWHPFRRGWSITLLDKGWDAQRVATLGGWQDLATFHRCYALQTAKSQRSMLETSPLAELIATASEGDGRPSLQLHRGDEAGPAARPSKRAVG